ncbi:(Lipo)protein [Seminavis robusta]|uniref:(Lipo)protein n=1 Tax=Seminavis robusta TaxID=568900 RepID=A0A9N8H3C7_9STRA|nr:(Lipo)protein [Seminavis robusta]|eukprot:Sro36_g022740.1 (Lipo)protein (432) ;mRNA; r:40288-41644
MNASIGMALRRGVRPAALYSFKSHTHRLSVAATILLSLPFLFVVAGGLRQMTSSLAQFPDRRPQRRLQGPPLTNDGIRDAVDLWHSNRIGAEATYGLMSQWDTSQVTDFSRLFEGRVTFNNPEILAWDTSRVVDFSFMFAGCRAFNQNLESWDFSSARSFHAMFNGAVSFQQDMVAGGWTQTANVTITGAMLKGATSWNGNVSGLDTRNVVDLNMMFYGAHSFQGAGIESWNVGKAERLDRLFMGASAFNGAIGSWAPRSATTMHSMFEDALLFSQDIRHWMLTADLINMSSMFRHARSFDYDLCWSTVNPRVMASDMFCGSPGSLDEACYNPSVVTWSKSCDAADGDFVAFYGDSHIDSAPTGMTTGINNEVLMEAGASAESDHDVFSANPQMRVVAAATSSANATIQSLYLIFILLVVIYTNGSIFPVY